MPWKGLRKQANKSLFRYGFPSVKPTFLTQMFLEQCNWNSCLNSLPWWWTIPKFWTIPPSFPLVFHTNQDLMWTRCLSCPQSPYWARRRTVDLSQLDPGGYLWSTICKLGGMVIKPLPSSFIRREGIFESVLTPGPLGMSHSQFYIYLLLYLTYCIYCPICVSTILDSLQVNS